MKRNVLRDRLDTLIAKVQGAVVQDCPPELHYCELCGQPQCVDADWQNCEKRLVAAEFMRTGDEGARGRLEQLCTKTADDGEASGETVRSPRPSTES